MNRSIAAGSEAKAKSSASDINVIVVDDSVLIREHVVDSLSSIAGVAAIRQAGDVPSGLQLLEANAPDVMVLDIEMPGQSGLDLLKIARSRDYTAVIIMFSIHDHPKLRQKCVDLGANFYFHKLREFERVAEVCRDVAARRAQQAQSIPQAEQE